MIPGPPQVITLRTRAEAISWFRALSAAVLVWLAASSPFAQDGVLDGQPIVRIVFERLDIFDTSQPKTSGWPYRAANSLHIKTKEGFLRSLLLFKEGEPYSEHAAEESARILRATGFLNPVDIVATAVEGGVELRVTSRDQWTLELGSQFGLFGGRESYGFEFQENNFLGWGKMVELEYSSDVERESYIYAYRDPAVANSRWQAELRYEDSSDGFLERLRLKRPFYSLQTPHAVGFHFERERLIEHLYSESDSMLSGRRRSELWSAWYGLRLKAEGKVTRRLIFGYDHRHDRFNDWRQDSDGGPVSNPDDRLVDGPRIAYQQVTDRFEVLRGFRSWTIQEDVAMGPNLDLGVTYSTPDFGGDIERVLFDGALGGAWHSDGWLLLGDGWFEGRFDEGDPRNWIYGARLSLSKLGRRGWQFRLFAESSDELDRDRQLTLGADIGLRGWSPDFFDGSGRAVANIQWRTMLKEDLFQILAIGIAVFADAGMTWDARVGRDTDGVRTTIGIGLVGDLTTVSVANLLRLEIGWPDDGSGPTVIVTSESLF